MPGGRLRWYENRATPRLPVGPATTFEANAPFVPYVSIVYDAGNGLSFYASYTETFAPQAGLTFERTPLRPVAGKQFEIGAKRGLFADRLLLSAALYRIDQTGRPQPDPRDIKFSVASGKVRSQGVEIEVNGELAPSFRLYGGYTFNNNEYLEDAALEGQQFTFARPRRSAKLWANYQPPERPWSLGAASAGRARSKRC